MNKIVPNFLFPTNLRHSKNIKRLIKDLQVQGYGIAVYLLETLASSEKHRYPVDDIDLLAEEMRVSVPIVATVIQNYGLFTVVETEDGKQFLSLQLHQWLEPYYSKIENASRAGKISALKKKQEQERQLRQLSDMDSTQQPLNECATIQLINKLKKEKKERLFSSFRNFKNFIIENYAGQLEFELPYNDELQLLEGTRAKLLSNGYLYNLLMCMDFTTEQAFRIWNYMFENQNLFLGTENEKK